MLQVATLTPIISAISESNKAEAVLWDTLYIHIIHLFVDGVVCGEVGGLGHVATLGLAAPASASSQQVEDGDCEAELGQDTHL